ncbi:MAG: porin [Gammaproteobacteria bacterium]|nr:porin [Gammaproteobacteria bacterium]
MTFRKSAVSLAVAGGLGSTVAPALAVDIGGYGRLDVGLLYVDAGQEVTREVDDFDDAGNFVRITENSGADAFLDVSGINSRFGWKGSEDLGTGMNAIYRFEFRVLADDANIEPSNRLSYVGLGNDTGSLTLGRQWSSQFNHVGTFLDPSWFVGNGYSLMGGAFRQSDMIKYAGSAGAITFDVDVRADGAFGGDPYADEYQVHGTFDSGAFSFSGGIRNVVASSGSDQQDIAIAGSIGIAKGAALRAGLINRADDSDKDSLLAGINASIFTRGGLSFLIGVDSFMDDDGGEFDTVMGGVYNRLSKRTRVYAEILGVLPDVGENATTLYAAIRHDY